ncbi:MAG: DUF4340 domain-containing protein [Planctomycetota bacterium]|nr:DUF4340 domain-containing protein [Planctomycetota bacterium]
MKPRHVIVMMVILAAGIAALLLLPREEKVGRKAEPGGLKPGEKLFKSFKAADVTAVEIKRADQTVRLDKKDGKWRVTSDKERPASESNINDLTRAFEGLEVKEERYFTRKENLEKFALTDAGAVHVKMFGVNNVEMAGLLLGKKPEDSWDSCFVRLPGSERVYEVNKDLTWSCGVKSEDRSLDKKRWLDLNLFSFKADDVAAFSIKTGHTTTTVEKRIPLPEAEKAGPGTEKAKGSEAGKGDSKEAAGKDGGKESGEAKAEKTEEKKEEEKKDEKKEEKKDEKKEEKKEPPKPVWMIVAPEEAEADQSNCDSVARSASWMRAQSYVDETDEKKMGFDNPQAKVLLRLNNGEEIRMIFGAKTSSGNDVYLKIDGRADIFTVSNYDYESVAKPFDKLKKEPPKTEEKKDEKKDEKKEEKAKNEKEDEKDDKADSGKEEKKDEKKQDEKKS